MISLVWAQISSKGQQVEQELVLLSLVPSAGPTQDNQGLARMNFPVGVFLDLTGAQT